MKAMILAAGRGERMRPLTDDTPKPLLKAGSKRLIEYHLLALRKAGITELVINTGWLGEQLPRVLGNGSQYNVSIIYSEEGYPALETAGGIIKALDQLGPEPFLVVNGDVFTDFHFGKLTLSGNDLGKLVLVPNPQHNAAGDFGLEKGKIVNGSRQEMLTFSGIGIYRPEMFEEFAQQRMPLKPVLDKAIDRRLLSGEVYKGRWMDIGTVERFRQLDRELSGKDQSRIT